MKDNEILEGNRLIAEFFGLKRGFWVSVEKPVTDDKKQWCDLDGKTFLGSRVYYDKTLLFHQSWDWIMPVVEKIEAIGYVIRISRLRCQIHTTNAKPICNIQSATKIEATYAAIVEFIKHHNQLTNV